MMHRYGVALVWVLALVVLAAMVGTGLVLPVLAAAAGQVALYLALVRHRAPSAGLRIPVLWSVQAGVTWAVAGSATPESVLAFVAVGLVFAVVGHVVLRMVGRAADAAVPDGEHDEPDEHDEGLREPRRDTAPLPVIEGYGSVQDPDPGAGRG